MKFEYVQSKDKRVLIYKIPNDKLSTGLFFAQYADDLIDFMFQLNTIMFVPCVSDDLYIYAAIIDFDCAMNIEPTDIDCFWEEWN
ncbi:hypothetical protein [Flavobacterium filum]|uniref:hypothetical protein n=1 Tax=Flavobacterium filum TaxID=370974 RepID=UPI0023F2A6B1|nr:hypothetical protein [Flavobacterium filum]